MTKIRVGVLRGGPSAEHEISLKTGENVLNFLPEKYLGIDIFLDKNGQWNFGRSPINLHQLHERVDIIFNALHGEFGEDGEAQHVFDTIKMPYTGSGIIASAAAMNKVLSREFFESAGIKIPKAIVIKNSEPPEEAARRVFQVLHPFWVVKPAIGGSSIGVSIVRDFNNLIPAMENAFKYSDTVLVEEYVSGREMTCGILDGFRDEKHYALPVIEIVPPPHKNFFDYECKYDGSSREICPANLDLSLKKEIENVARLAHRVLGCEGYSRADMIASSNPVSGGASGIYLLEVNTLPGLTSESLVPKAAQAVGLEFPKLLEHIIELALNKTQRF